jgi:hypothetical protein
METKTGTPPTTGDPSSARFLRKIEREVFRGESAVTIRRDFPRDPDGDLLVVTTIIVTRPFDPPAVTA